MTTKAVQAKVKPDYEVVVRYRKGVQKKRLKLVKDNAGRIVEERAIIYSWMQANHNDYAYYPVKAGQVRVTIEKDPELDTDIALEVKIPFTPAVQRNSKLYKRDLWSGFDELLGEHFSVVLSPS